MNIINSYRFAGLPTFGNASRDFSGTGQYITVPDSASFPTGAQTWACWVKADAITGNHFLMSHYIGTGDQRSVLLYIQSNGSVKVNIAPAGSVSGLKDTITAASAITTGAWYHVAMEYVPSTHIKIFIDGSQAAINTGGIPSAAHDSTDDFSIGGATTGTALLNGKIADARIYDADIGATQIANLAAGTDYQTNLIGWWLTDTNDAVTDFAGTFADGTNNGTTYSTDGPLD